MPKKILEPTQPGDVLTGQHAIGSVHAAPLIRATPLPRRSTASHAQIRDDFRGHMRRGLGR